MTTTKVSVVLWVSCWERFRTRGCASAEQFLERAKSDLVDCLLLDIHIDGMWGFDRQRYLVASGSDLPVIFMRGRDAPWILAGCVIPS